MNESEYLTDEDIEDLGWLEGQYEMMGRQRIADVLGKVVRIAKAKQASNPASALYVRDSEHERLCESVTRIAFCAFVADDERLLRDLKTICTRAGVSPLADF
jgi:hypothetical protein